jgi:hypothetical protein
MQSLEGATHDESLARTENSDAACIAAGSLQLQATSPHFQHGMLQKDSRTHRVCMYLLCGLAAARVGAWKRGLGRTLLEGACMPTRNTSCRMLHAHTRACRQGRQRPLEAISTHHTIFPAILAGCYTYASIACMDVWHTHPLCLHKAGCRTPLKSLLLTVGAGARNPSAGQYNSCVSQVQRHFVRCCSVF